MRALLPAALITLGGCAVLEPLQLNTAGGTNNGKNAVGVSNFTANLGVDWSLPWVKGLSVGGRAIYTSGAYADAANLQSLDRNAVTPRVFQYIQFLGFNSTAFRADANARAVGNALASGTLIIDQARLLCASSFVGSNIVRSRKYKEALNPLSSFNAKALSPLRMKSRAQYWRCSRSVNRAAKTLISLSSC